MCLLFVVKACTMLAEFLILNFILVKNIFCFNCGYKQATDAHFLFFIAASSKLVT